MKPIKITTLQTSINRIVIINIFKKILVNYLLNNRIILLRIMIDYNIMYKILQKCVSGILIIRSIIYNIATVETGIYLAQSKILGEYRRSAHNYCGPALLRFIIQYCSLSCSDFKLFNPRTLDGAITYKYFHLSYSKNVLFGEYTGPLEQEGSRTAIVYCMINTVFFRL